MKVIFPLLEVCPKWFWNFSWLLNFMATDGRAQSGGAEYEDNPGLYNW